jgi:predicted nucleic acid-binding protein
MLFVYLLEDHPQFGERVERILKKMRQREDLLCTSAFTVGEILVGPYKRQAENVGRAIREFFHPPAVEVLGFDAPTAEIYARIRAANVVSAADAIHLASAANARADLFLTNDRTLRRMRIPGIQFIAGLDTDLF